MFLNDQAFMTRALELASKGEGAVNPNPLVGAVVVVDSQIVGEGWHQRFGGPHAEINALNEAGAASNGATLYVTLEPCCHHGKTPPCTQRIIQSGIRKVVVATRDPNPVINGKGLATLREAGIEVHEGVMEDEAVQQNEIFLTFIRRGTPFVELKLAMSLDGRIATKTGDAKWITGEESRIEGHRLRRKHMAIAVGVETVIQDDPSLNVRHVEGKDPLPIVLDTTGRTPLSSKLLQAPAKAIVATCSMPEDTERQIRETGAQVWRLPQANGRVSIPALLARMAEEPLDSLLIEGGGEIAAAFLEAGAVDKVSFFYAPILIGGREAVPGIGGSGVERVADAPRLKRVEVQRLGEDLYLTGYVAK
ncbi:bifunctional diaminohydroxyphosphoribosylaminopyrimidine deaminase/5-amino-6-(5-phosphoribosylamino)uracil reductase RibD [Candidatus Bipolaricaulota bacterium]|nr:bifunctional diaminohydroxyphosphoribosylaminopyrimidine deaminase/5-amino-6-(5-phosphoribosylamino)uracil reductase RibD [Candidatus Bipolaricaulota bacterium]